ncbi:hypothetical protein AB3329_01085 [Streptococcus sp. H31]|uniref:hypothetical protein n=1 Tax=Streptococcus huangxiaojuni TaxID=3237239 RepID=UPI0034A28C34
MEGQSLAGLLLPILLQELPYLLGSFCVGDMFFGDQQVFGISVKAELVFVFS